MPITARDLALVRLSAAAYNDDPRGSLPAGFTAVSAAQLGYTPSGGEAYANGAFRNGTAQAIVATGLIEGQQALVLAFRAADERQDSIDTLRDINAAYGPFARLIAAVDATAAGGSLGTLHVTGHSLGGAMAQLYAWNHPGAAFYADSFGSPGARIPDGDDLRVREVIVADDPAVWLGEHRAEVGDALRDNPLLAGAAIFSAAELFPGLTTEDAARSISSLTYDYENRGARVVVPGALDQAATIASLQEAFNAMPTEHAIGLYVAKVNAAYEIAHGLAPEAQVHWQNADGSAAVWNLNGTMLAGGGVIGDPGGSWKLVGTGDFDADTRTDLLWRDDSGLLAVWQTRGTDIVGGGLVGNPGSNYGVAGTGDFNGDSRSDVLLRATDGTVAVWELQGSGVLAKGTIASPGGSWAIAGTGDFDGDGRTDILWRDGPGGSLAIWRMDGTAVAGGGLAGNPGGFWTIVGTGDFNGDGRSDILFQGADGTAGIWLMNGTTLLEGHALTNPGTNWKVVDTGDYDGDDRAEILWRSTDGTVAVWDTDGRTVTGGGLVASAGSEWQVVG